MNYSKYRVKPGSKVRLKDWDPGDKSAVPASKEDRLARLIVLSEEINKQQDLLYAAHEEGIKGSITTGKLADFVVLAEDPHAIAAAKIKDIQIVRTVVSGATVFQA